ncbi:hypothetical protein [Nitrosospira multiformis]|nr:hypothetical protein [Nitrosospira multiformis]
MAFTSSMTQLTFSVYENEGVFAILLVQAFPVLLEFKPDGK